ncbi:ATP/GTP-binding protein [Taibaiella chishuiensis]|uniref:AAA domain-containing protein n=1 Tax=Taibaiella chishuiensis TaxID=1434707 RepID=A0A2P8DDG4_9BACT|nr:ATP-binding protein [Taibaiella chishuiensis]PSK95239.1 AAA domain-containing protein [Taibaiella chishuiensis]
MKIAITGAHNTGKTTLAEGLQEFLPGYTFKQEPYYQLEEQGHLFAATPDVDDFLVQLRYALAATGTTGEDIVFDRCPLDFLAYMQVLGAGELVRDWYDEVASFMAAIDLLVYVPVERPDRLGCPDDELPELREAVDEILAEWVYDFDVPVLEVRGTLAERVRQVVNKTG